ncbi:50S ribosomal protein L25 [Candidatus Dojkabacteria bacterium]|nr:50S ribosomal protein L25 [Candidatus Dojkabacteria bacterium]
MKLVLKKREVLGRKVKTLRNQNILPGSIYGPERDPTNIIVDASDFNKVFQKTGFSQLIDFKIEGSKNGEGKMLIKEVQIHPLKDIPMHVSFYQVDMGQNIKAEIPLAFEGEAPAARKNIGVFVSPISELEVSCIPSNLPEKFVIDITELEEVGDSIHVEEIKLPEGVEFTHNVPENLVIAYIAPPQKKIVEEVVEKPAEDEELEELVEGEEGVEGEGEGEEGVAAGEGEGGEERPPQPGAEKTE